jgi:DNA polymerase-1
MGDSSDNIPGVKGIGEKSALNLLKKYETLDNIYANIDEITGAIGTKLKNYKEDAFMSRTLATIIRNIPFEFDLKSFKIVEFDKEKLFHLFNKLQFRSFIEKFSLLPGDIQQHTTKIDIEYVNVDDIEILNKLNKEVQDKGFCGIYLVKSLDEKHTLGISTGEEKAYFIEFYSNIANKKKEVISEIFQNNNIKKYVSDLKVLVHLLKKLEIYESNNFFDVSIGAYILDPSSQKYTIKDLAQRYLNFNETSDNDEIHRNARNALLCYMISQKIEPFIKEYGHEKLFYDIEMPLPFIMDDMETRGIKIDLDALKEYGNNLNVMIKEVEQEIYSLANEVFNINSPKQLGHILFEKLSLPVKKKNKTGYSTDAEVLEELKEYHPVIEKILTNRQLVKINTTYVESLYGLIDNASNKVHTKFNQTGTVTGRFTSVEPNLQNIPYKQEIGRKIRKVFVPSNDEYVLVGADYSQVELRILAHISEDENLIDAYIKGLDIHSMTASKIFGTPVREVTSLQRTRAKAINFGIIYGLGEFSLAKDIGVTRKEAKEYIEEYLGQYPKVKEYMVKIVNFARENGYVETIFGRRRYLPDILSKNFNIRTFGERAALNAPIQGTAADIMKIAMIKIYNELKKNSLMSAMVLQVHDEILIDTHRTEIQLVKSIVKKSMESVAQLKVPLLVDVKEGINWYETK